MCIRDSLWGVPPTWLWVDGFSPQILEHPTSICDTGVNAALGKAITFGMPVDVKTSMSYHMQMSLQRQHVS